MPRRSPGVLDRLCSWAICRSCLITSPSICFFSSRRRHTRSLCDWSSTCALPICIGRGLFLNCIELLFHQTQLLFQHGDLRVSVAGGFAHVLVTKPTLRAGRPLSQPQILL